MESEALKSIKVFRFKVLTDLYNQLSDEQKKVFNLMYFGGPENVPDNKIDWAIQQCENSVRKNKAMNNILGK